MKFHARWIIGFGFLCISAMPATALESYFINQEVRADNVEMFPKWMSMLAHYDAESHALDTICGSGQYDTCKLKTWSQYIESLRGKTRLEQMDAINSYINQYPYIEDIVNWGVDDYWATVYEFQRKSGDCEDYAIAKWTSLRALGVPNDDMRIEIVQDLSLGGVIHAVLVVYVADKMYVLDNQIKQVTLASDIYHYKPIYSINETHWWQHIITQ